MSSQLHKFLIPCLTGALLVSGCASRAPTAASESAAAAEPTAEVTVSPTPAPTQTPVPTECPHTEWKNGQCVQCGQECPHEEYADGFCTQCGAEEFHNYDENGVCLSCGISREELLAPGYGEDGRLLPSLTDSYPENRGEVVTLYYETQNYHGSTTGAIRKEMQVYVPYNYDENQKYNVLILLHGKGQHAFTWLSASEQYGETKDDATTAPIILDNMVDQGLLDNVIVAAVTYYRDSENPATFYRPVDYPNFITELRTDILPLIAERWSTYAVSSSIDDIIAARDHFGIAGLSMGSVVIYSDILQSASDLFAWYGCFSGCDGYIDWLTSELDNRYAIGTKIRLFYNTIGTEDEYFLMQQEYYEQLTAGCRALEDGVNSVFIPREDCGHDFNVWYNGMYDCLRLFFK